MNKVKGGLKMKELMNLFIIFFNIGAFTFGGGYAMLPFIQREIVDKRGWATEEEVLDYYAIGQVTPGIIAVNTATFIGYKIKGVKGAFAATLGMITPSIIIITAIAMFFEAFAEYALIQNALWGIRIVAVALIVSAVYKMGKKSIIDKFTLTIFLIGFLLLILTPISPMVVVIAAAVIGNLAMIKKGEN